MVTKIMLPEDRGYDNEDNVSKIEADSVPLTLMGIRGDAVYAAACTCCKCVVCAAVCVACAAVCAVCASYALYALHTPEACSTYDTSVC